MFESAWSFEESCDQLAEYIFEDKDYKREL
jgi:hypothetical protein